MSVRLNPISLAALQHGPTDTGQVWVESYASGKKWSAQMSERSLGKHNIDYTHAIGS
jgi:hypothetical protein